MSVILVDGQTLHTDDINRGIGNVFINLLNEIAKSDLRHELILLAPNPCPPDQLSKISKKIKIIQENFTNQIRNRREKQSRYEDVASRIIENENVDWFWSPNPLMPNVSFLLDKPKCKSAVTLFDLIPLQDRGAYLDRWPKNMSDEYLRRIQEIQNWDAIIGISNSSCKEFIDRFPNCADKVFCAEIGVDHSNYWPFSFDFDPFLEPYIISVLGNDPRKETRLLIEAFAALVKEEHGLPDALRLVLCGKFPMEKVNEFLDFTEKLGVRDRVDFTGYLPVHSISSLVRRALISVNPSRLEGFGLPIAEAMASGVPVVSADIPSSREVAGDLGWFFQVGNSVSLRKAMISSISARREGSLPQKTLLEKAAIYSWKNCASKYGDVFEGVSGSFKDNVMLCPIVKKKSVAMLTPWPPEKSGIAQFSFQLATLMRKYFKLTIVTNTNLNPEKIDDCDVICFSIFEQKMEEFDEYVVHIGNNTKYHKEFYEFASEYPSRIICHDPNIHPFLLDAFGSDKEDGLYFQALNDLAEKGGATEGDIFSSELNVNMVRNSLLTIFHSSEAKKRVVEKLQGDLSKKKCVATHFPVNMDYNFMKSTEPSPLIGKLKKELEGCRVVGHFGFVNKAKRLTSVLEAVKALHQDGFNIKFLIVGENNDDQIGLSREISSRGIDELCIQLGRVNDKEFFALQSLCDVIVNLRYSTMGEASASLYTALSNRCCVIASDVGQFSEIPSSAVWCISTGDDEIQELTLLLSRLLVNSDLRRSLGANGYEYVSTYCDYEKYIRTLML